MSILNSLTFVFSFALLGLAVVLFRLEWKAAPPAGDRGRRRRRTLGAMLLGFLAAGLMAWELIDGRMYPVLFLNVSTVLLLLVGALIAIALYDWKAVHAAERHRRLSMITQELYGVTLKEMSGKAAERVGRDALKQVIRAREEQEASDKADKECGD